MPGIIRSHGNRQRRIPAWPSMALVLLIASTQSPRGKTASSVDAFALPKHRVRVHQANTLSVVSMEDKKRSSGKDEKDEAEDDSLTSKRNGKELVNGSKPPPGSPLSLLCEDAEIKDTFEIQVGRALDTLKKDYPRVLTDKPDFSIFDEKVEVIDPSGVKLHGIKNYKNAFRLMHAIVQVFYCPERSGLTFRMCYDTARQSIRVSWNAEVIPKAIFGGVRTTLHVDGISVYEISQKSGMITQHRIERLVINDTPVRPQQGIFAMLRNEHDESVPVFNAASSTEHLPTNGFGSTAMEFRQQQHSVLFDDQEYSSTALSAVSAGDNSDGPGENKDYPGIDWDAFERKNESRKKFGLDPITPEEFMENEAAVKQMEMQQRQRAASASAAAEMTNEQKSRQQGFFDKLFGDIIPDSCESNFDCERPEICCDFGFKKVCCASGTMVGNQKLEPAYLPVPADIYRPGEEPRNMY